MSQNVPFLFGPSGGQNTPGLPGLLASRTPQSQPQQPAMAVQQDQQASAAALQQNASLMAALQGVSPEQLGLIVAALQSGQLSLPPALTQAQTNGTPSRASEQQSAPPPVQAAVGDDIQEAEIHGDMEDGEVDEGDLGDMAVIPDFIQPPPTGPRKHRTSRRNEHAHIQPQDRSSGRSDQPSTQDGFPAHPNGHAAQPRSNRHSSGKRLVSKKTASKEFLLAMVNAGYTYEQLVRTDVNPIFLNAMFKELGLPIPPTSAQSAAMRKDPSTEAPPPTTTQNLASEQPRKLSSTKKAEIIPKLSREEYLAKLQAAKSKKTSTTPVSAGSATKPPLALKEATGPTQPSLQITQNKASAAPKLMDKETRDRILKERLAKLKAAAAEKAKKPSLVSGPILTSPPGQATTAHSNAPTRSLSGDLGNETAINTLEPQMFDQQLPAPQQGALEEDTYATSSAPSRPVSALPFATFSPPPASNSVFSALPGLFMAGNRQFSAQAASPSRTSQGAPGAAGDVELPSAVSVSILPQQQQPSPRAIPPDTPDPVAAPAPLSRKRAVASDFDETPEIAVPAKRPFGQSRHDSTDEEMIIEVSDASDDDDNFDMDVEPITTKQGSIRDMPPLRDFPPRPTFGKSSLPVTPGAMTPGALEYQHKMAEIEKMKRRLADLQSRQKPKPSATVATPSSGIATPDAQSTPKQYAASPPKIATNSEISSLSRAGKQTDSYASLHSAPGANGNVYEQEDLRQRIATIERETAQGHGTGKFNTPAKPTGGVLPGTSADDIQSEPGTDGDAAEVLAESSPGSGGVGLSGISDSTNAHGLYAATESTEAAAESFDEDESADGEVDSSSAGREVSEPTGREADATVVHNESEVSPIEVTDGGPALAPARTGRGLNPLATRMPSPDETRALSNMPGLQQVRTATVDAQRLVPAKSSRDQDAATSEEFPPSQETDTMSMEVDGESSEHEDGSTSSMNTSGVSDGEDFYADDGTNDDPDEPNLPAVTSVSHAETMAGATNRTGGHDDTDLAPGTQSLRSQNSAPADLPFTHTDTDKPRTYFTTYRSPLQSFKDFRYHPAYASTVPGGFKSLTYNHRLDAEKPLCPFEAAGGICNDRACPHQHFRDMAFTDNDLIRALGTEYGSRHEELRTKWNQGLAAIITQLKTSPLSRDANAIAARIAEYRRSFMKDPTQVVDFEYWEQQKAKSAK